MFNWWKRDFMAGVRDGYDYMIVFEDGVFYSPFYVNASTATDALRKVSRQRPHTKRSYVNIGSIFNLCEDFEEQFFYPTYNDFV